MSVHQYLLIGGVKRRPDARSLVKSDVDALAVSIRELGLLNPISCRIVSDGYEVIAGSNRLAAMEQLGEREILAKILDLDDDHAELAMIDENLCRAELSPADRAAQMARRKVIYERLHPEKRQGGAPGLPGGGKAKVDNLSSFAEATAEATGRDARSVRRDAERGAKVIDEVLDLIRGTKLDTGAYLDRIKNLPPNDQVQAAKRDLAIDKKQRRAVSEAADRAEAHSDAKRAREAEQAEHERRREEVRAQLPEGVRQQIAAKTSAMEHAGNSADDRVDALEAEVEELREANAALTKDIEAVRAENALYAGMKIEWEKGGFEQVVNGIRHQLAVVGKQVETISSDRAAYLAQAKSWRKRAIDLGYSSEEVIDLREGARG